MKNFVLFVFYLFVTSHFFGQKPIVKLEIEPKSVQIGDEIVVTVKTNVQGEIDIDFPSAFVNGYAVMNGMEQEMDYNTVATGQNDDCGLQKGSPSSERGHGSHPE